MASSVVALPHQNKKHDVFLSHSGKQKGFVRDLSSRLRSQGYSVFFDQNDDSLPPGEAFAPLIFSAANTCNLALVIISDDFLRSKWPMMELCALVDRLDTPHFTILPLFFKLSPAAIKDERNIEEWRKEWETFEQIRKGRITAAKCEKAVTKVLPSLNGVVRCPESQQGESSYIDEVVDRISNILRPRNLVRFREGVDPHRHHVGKERLCQVILDEFRKLEEEHDSSSSQVSILGMYGVPGSGKSTLCDFLRESMFDEFGGKVIYLKLPTELREGDVLMVKEQYMKLLSMLIPHKKDLPSMDLDQLYNQLLFHGARFRMFLVLDNISPSNRERYKTMLQAIMRSDILSAGSRVMLVAQSNAILEDVLMEVEHSHAYASTQVPSLTEEEVSQLIRNRYPSVTDDVLTHLLDKCSFRSASFMYIPFVFEQIGILLRGKGCSGVKDLWKTVDEGKKDAVKMLVETNFKQFPEGLQVLFFDIALFIIPAGYSKLSDATPILSRMHGINDNFQLEWKMKELQKYCALSVMEDELTVHDIFTEHARSIPGNSNRYVNRPSLNVSDLLVTSDQNFSFAMYSRRIHLKCLEARTLYIGIAKGSLYCCNDDEEVFLHLEVGGGAQAVHMRNNLSPYSECILVLAGDPSSLVSLQTENVQQVALWSSAWAKVSDANLCNLVSLELRNDEKSLRGLRVSSSLEFVSRIQKTVESMTRWLWKRFFPRCKQCLPGTYNMLHVRRRVFRRRMPWLRAIVLNNVGTGRLEIGSRYCPELEVLEVRNKPEEPMHVSICDAPKLTKLVTGGYHDHIYFPSLFRHPIARNPRTLVFQLRKCPELRTVDVDGSFDQVRIVGLLPSKLRELSLANDRRDEFIPMKLIRSSMHQLSQLETLRLSGCRGLENFEYFGTSLPCLKTMVLEECASLARLSIGSGCMPNLVDLDVSCCEKLQVIEGFEDILMQQLKYLHLSWLPQLRLECDVMRLGSSCEGRQLQLEEIHLCHCPNVRIDFHVLEASNNLQLIDILLKNVVEKKQSDDAIIMSNASRNKLAMQEVDRSSSSISRMQFLKGRFRFLRSLHLSRLDHLREIKGIQHLPDLQWFYLWNLPNLFRVSETWPARIAWIRLDGCPMLLEIPPLENTPQLDTLECHKCVRLEAVEGEMSMKRSTWVELIECESMEVHPVEQGSKFANVDVMRTWLQDVDGEVGSPVFEAAVQALLWEHTEKGDRGALDALRVYFSALAHINNDNDDPLLKLYLHNLFFPSDPENSLFYWFGFHWKKGKYHKKQQLKSFEEWIIQAFRLHCPHNSHKTSVEMLGV